MDAGGFEVAFHGEYLEIVPGEKIVSTEVYEGLPEGVTEEEGAPSTPSPSPKRTAGRR